MGRLIDRANTTNIKKNNNNNNNNTTKISSLCPSYRSQVPGRRPAVCAACCTLQSGTLFVSSNMAFLIYRQQPRYIFHAFSRTDGVSETETTMTAITAAANFRLQNNTSTYNGKLSWNLPPSRSQDPILFSHPLSLGGGGWPQVPLPTSPKERG